MLAIALCLSFFTANFTANHFVPITCAEALAREVDVVVFFPFYSMVIV